MVFPISIIVPTYNERPNIKALVEELSATLALHADIDAELILVDDDSPDGTARAARSLPSPLPLRVIQRAGKFGLGSAVMTGFAASRRPYLAVMDGDLSHDPAVLPAMVHGLAHYDLTVGSRFGSGSRVERWTFGRKWLSLAGTGLARRLTGIEDPLSGYFCLRRDVLASMRGPLVSPGYKILLEILMRGQVRAPRSYDYAFRQRQHSASKLNTQEYLFFLKQVAVYAITRPACRQIRLRTRFALGRQAIH